MQEDCAVHEYSSDMLAHAGGTGSQMLLALFHEQPGTVAHDSMSVPEHSPLVLH